jgi:hypothetical protein
MSQMLEATFDGEVFRPAEVVELKPDTVVHLIVTVKTPPVEPNYACKAGSAEHIPHSISDDFDEPLEDFREYTE